MNHGHSLIWKQRCQQNDVQISFPSMYKLTKWLSDDLYVMLFNTAIFFTQ